MSLQLTFFHSHRYWTASEPLVPNLCSGKWIYLCLFLSDSSRRSAPVHRGSRGTLLPQDFWKESREWGDRVAKTAAGVPAFLGGCPVSAPGTDRRRKPFRPETRTWTHISPIPAPSLPPPLLTVYCTVGVHELLKFKNLRHLNKNFSTEKYPLP